MFLFGKFAPNTYMPNKYRVLVSCTYIDENHGQVSYRRFTKEHQYIPSCYVAVDDHENRTQGQVKVSG